MEKDEPTKKITELLPEELEPDDFDNFIFQLIPFFVGGGLFFFLSTLNLFFSIMDRIPGLVLLVWSVILFICNVSFVTIVIKKQFYFRPYKKSLRIIRGIPAIIVGILGFLFFAYFGIQNLIRYFELVAK